jgi:hypothetical protein
VRTTLLQAGVPTAPPVRKPRRKRPLPRRFERARPNQLWQSDITSMVLPRSGHRISRRSCDRTTSTKSRWKKTVGTTK